MNREKEKKVYFDDLYDASQFKNMYPWIEGLLFEYFNKGFYLAEQMERDNAKARTADNEE